VAPFLKFELQRTEAAFNQFMKRDIEPLLKFGPKGVALRANAGT
jgi:hypothetical protein